MIDTSKLFWGKPGYALSLIAVASIGAVLLVGAIALIFDPEKFEYSITVASVVAPMIAIPVVLFGTARKAEIEKARDRAAEAEAAKTRFLASVSHEIRTPMNGVLGMAELLMNSPLDADQTVYARTIHSSGSALLTIINDILDFSKIESGKLQLDPTPFDIRRLVEDVATLLRPSATARGLYLDIDWRDGAPERLIADEGRIRQVLTNLIGNAIKFTKEGGVRVAVEGAANGGAADMRFEIVDTGIGVPADKLDEIFEQFTQAEASTTRQFGGTGLGLTICRRLMDAMGGEIGVRSKLGRGSTFWFTFSAPLAARHALQRSGASASEASRSPATATTERTRILVADDNEVNRLVIQHMLDPARHEAVFAVNGEDAAMAASDGGFDIVLMDISMPVLDGYDAARRIRAEEERAGRGPVPIIALSAHILNVDDPKLIAAGFNGVLNKPISQSRLFETLDAHAPQPSSAIAVAS